MDKRLLEQRSLNRRIIGITMPITRKRIKYGRNWPCLCGSKDKYKNCCMAEIDSLTASDGNANITTLPDDIQKMIDEYQKEKDRK